MRRLGIRGRAGVHRRERLRLRFLGVQPGHLALRAGQCDIALAVGAEKMNIPDKAKMFAAFDGGWDVSTVEQNKATLLAMGEGRGAACRDHVRAAVQRVHGRLRGLCRNHMQRYGTTQRQIAAVAAKNHGHSVHNPLAQFQTPFSIEQVLASPPIAYPLTTLMCSPISDGAAAVVLCNAAGLKKLNGAGGRAMRVLASVVQTGSDRGIDEREKIVAHLAAQEGLRAGRRGPERCRRSRSA